MDVTPVVEYTLVDFADTGKLGVIDVDATAAAMASGVGVAEYSLGFTVDTDSIGVAALVTVEDGILKLILALDKLFTTVFFTFFRLV